MNETILTFANKSLKLKTIMGELKTLPVIEVKLSELATDNNLEKSFATRTIENDDKTEEVSVFCYEGKYIVLTGRSAVKRVFNAGKAIFKARLISKQALKRMQLIQQPVELVPLEPIQKQYFSKEYAARQAQQIERPYVPPTPPEPFNRTPRGTGTVRTYDRVED